MNVGEPVGFTFEQGEAGGGVAFQKHYGDNGYHGNWCAAAMVALARLLGPATAALEMPSA